MSKEYLSEAFQALNILNEDTFDVNADGVVELKKFVDSDNKADDMQIIIDPLADTEEDLQNSYIGKAILDCVICDSKIYKDPEEVIINEDNTLANISETCPYCQSNDGFKVIGQVAEYKPEPEVTVEVEEKEELDESIISKRRSPKNRKKPIRESKKINKYIFFSHSDPETLHLVKNVPDDAEIWDYELQWEDVSDLKGENLIYNNDEYLTSESLNGKTLQQLDKEFYDRLVNHFKDPKEKEFYYDDYLVLETLIYREEFEDYKDSYKNYISEKINNSYVDGDSGFAIKILNLDDNKFEEYRKFINEFNGEDDYDDEDLDESIISKRRKPIKENIENIKIETEKEKITVNSEEKEPTGEETISPIEPETEDKFKYQDIEIDEFDENDFDELGEKYLRNVYENVASYKTLSGSTNGNKIKLEGLITFKSGKKAKTNFVFESHILTKNGKLKFLGENKQFAKSKQSFILTGRADGSKLMVESLTYNYRAQDGKTNTSKRVYGTVSKTK